MIRLTMPLAMLMALAAEVAMPARAGGVHLACSVSQGFAIDKASQADLGYLESLSLGKLALGRDLRVQDPTDSEQTLKVVGVISKVAWEGGLADPISITCQVSASNRLELATLMDAAHSDEEVVFQFTVYGFDPKSDAHFKAFYPVNGDLHGHIRYKKHALAMALGQEAGQAVASPKNFTFSFEVEPADEAMNLEVGFGTQSRVPKPWGKKETKH